MNAASVAAAAAADDVDAYGDKNRDKNSSTSTWLCLSSPPTHASSSLL